MLIWIKQRNTQHFAFFQLFYWISDMFFTNTVFFVSDGKKIQITALLFKPAIFTLKDQGFLIL